MQMITYTQNCNSANKISPKWEFSALNGCKFSDKKKIFPQFSDSPNIRIGHWTKTNYHPPPR